MDAEFMEFDKIARLSRECVITEKLDGTNAQVHVFESGVVMAGSRNRYITPMDDNFGFAAWVEAHYDELRTGLGPGRHFGEWWGAGIQRRYGLAEKRFSLFNTARWVDLRTDASLVLTEKQTQAPSCCYVVPVLYRGTFTTAVVDHCIATLRMAGSAAAPGFMDPEGVVVWHDAARQLFKKTLHKDEAPKSQSGVRSRVPVTL
jgi:hypothetical protein